MPQSTSTARPPIVTIIGPTASGKTAVAAHLAHLLGGAVVSGDSRQVYRGMDIGTGKDLSEYTIDREQVPYYLIDIAEAGERYNVHRYVRDFDHIYAKLRSEGTPVVLCGGSGLYVEAAIAGHGLGGAPEDPQLRAELSQLSLSELQTRLDRYGEEYGVEDRANARRLIRALEIAEHEQRQGSMQTIVRSPIHTPIYCIDISRDERRRRISDRLERRVQEGMITEVEQLLETLSPDQLMYYGLEYLHVTRYVTGQVSYDKMLRELEIAIHQFAKRQMTWIRGMERRGLRIEYIQPHHTPRETAREILQRL